MNSSADGTPGDLVPQRSAAVEHAARHNRWSDERRHAFDMLSPAALCLVASDGPVSLTLWGRTGEVTRLGHNRGVWPAKIAKTSQVKDTVTASYNKGLFFIGTQFRIWCLTDEDRDTLASSVLGLISARAEADGGLDELINGYKDLGPDLDLDFFEMECHGLADRLGLPHWDDAGLECFLDRVAARVAVSRVRGKGLRDEHRAYDDAAMKELGRV